MVKIMKCELWEKCPLFNDKMSAESSLLTIFKNNYCLNNYLTCARFMVADRIGREHIPIDLYPNESGKAILIINKYLMYNEKQKL